LRQSLKSEIQEMNFPRFIAQRILKNNEGKQLSRPIVRIATWGIAVGVALMLLSAAVVKGFQDEIRKKVIGFGSHFHVVVNEAMSKESYRVEYSEQAKNDLLAVEGVRHVQVFASKPGILETDEALQGVVIKGLGADYDWSFFSDKLVEGELLHFAPAKRLVDDAEEPQLEIIISTYLAKRMKLKLADRVSLYFINSESDARQRNFYVKGIYETGLEEFDKQYVFIDIAQVQKLSNWGMQTFLTADSVCRNGSIAIEATTYSGDGKYQYTWPDSRMQGAGPHFIAPTHDTTIVVVANDRTNTLPDTAWIEIDFADDASSEPCREFSVTSHNAGGSQRFYVGGYEVLIENYNDLLMMDDKLFSAKPFDMQLQKITDRSPELFAWLDMLDINVWIIVILMVVISIVNMTSALLIIILERQRMIGTLKALGIENHPVIRIFLINAAYIIGRGMILGNIIGLGIAWLQWKFGIIALPAETYYLDHVPVMFQWSWFVALNVVTLAICLMFLIIPAQYVTKISPIKAIRFS